jgi:hypothetical protein
MKDVAVYVMPLEECLCFILQGGLVDISAMAPVTDK